MSRKTNRDHAKKKQRPMMEDEEISSQLEALLTPAITSGRKLLPSTGDETTNSHFAIDGGGGVNIVMARCGLVTELTRMLAREGFLWCNRMKVSQQALSQRFLTFPAPLFEGVFKEVLPQLKEKWLSRNSREIPESIQFTLTKFERIWIADGSTLEALFSQLKSLEDIPKGQLAGKMGIVIDLMTRLPLEIWFKENPRASDTNFEKDVLSLVKANTLLLLDRGFYHFRYWLKLIDKEIHFITRLKKRAAIQVEQVFTNSYSIRDRKIRLGSGTKKTPYITLRLVEVKSGKVWHSYLTSVLDPFILPPYVVADLYRRRWRIEQAFNTVKRLLGLSYLWTGSINGIQLQIWRTWLFYAILVDLGDAVADELSLTFEHISLEMIYRGLYHFSVAHQKGLATDPVKYFAARENQDLGIVKQKRKPNTKLIIAPFPDQKHKNQPFFFQKSILSIN